jgi:hypothetical protein
MVWKWKCPLFCLAFCAREFVWSELRKVRSHLWNPIAFIFMLIRNSLVFFFREGGNVISHIVIKMEMRVVIPSSWHISRNIQDIILTFNN